jgi:alkanesulfonate monooxygenase SsuD/methylene tetrahydromethanopterin reductase-like flavin-dependent oxidoreductase (luciferase family)
VTFDEYVSKRAVLEEHCRRLGRDPATSRRSLMVPVITGRTTSEVTARRERAVALFPRLPADEAGWRTLGLLHGVVADVCRDLERWRDLGFHRVLLQLIDHEDATVMELIAREIIPRLR